MKDLTDRQRSLLSFIEHYYEDNGIMPTLSEISERFSYSDKAAWDAVEALIKKGFLEKEKGEHRAIRLKKEERDKRENVKIPLYSGEITAAALREESSECLYLGKSIAAGRNLFAIRVNSVSMKNAGILPFDIAVLDKDTLNISDNDIVLAAPKAADEDAGIQLRRYRKTPYFAELWPENDSMGIIKAPEFSFYGVLVLIIRSY